MSNQELTTPELIDMLTTGAEMMKLGFSVPPALLLDAAKRLAALASPSIPPAIPDTPTVRFMVDEASLPAVEEPVSKSMIKRLAIQKGVTPEDQEKRNFKSFNKLHVALEKIAVSDSAYPAQIASDALIGVGLWDCASTAPAESKATIEPFTVKHYASDQRPIIKGNGFDGLEIGESREAAEEFISFVNNLCRCAPKAMSDEEIVGTFEKIFQVELVEDYTEMFIDRSILKTFARAIRGERG